MIVYKKYVVYVHNISETGILWVSIHLITNTLYMWFVCLHCEENQVEDIGC